MRLAYSEVEPKIYRAMLGFSHAVDEGPLERPLLELVKIRASQLNGCGFCLDMHVKDALALGEQHHRLHLVAAWREAGDNFTARERAALEWCEHLTRLAEHADVPDDLYQRVRREFSEAEAVHLTWAVCAINSWNRMAVAMAQPAGGYVSRLAAEPAEKPPPVW